MCSSVGLGLTLLPTLHTSYVACRGSGVRVSLAPFNRSPASGWVFLLPMRGDDSARCPVLVQKDEALQALGAHLDKGGGLGT